MGGISYRGAQVADDEALVSAGEGGGYPLGVGEVIPGDGAAIDLLAAAHAPEDGEAVDGG